MLRSAMAFSLAIICTSSSFPTSAQAIKATLPRAKRAAIDAAIRAEMETQRVVGVAIGLVQNGRIVYVKGYGLADREGSSPVTTETLFNWASNSKPVAAVAAMQLVERGKLDLDAEVRRYVPEFPDKGAVITVRQLLCHQSGIPHYSNGKILSTDRSYESERPFLDPVLALDRFNKSPLLFEPGTRASYSSYAYVLLSAVIQRAGDHPFFDQIQERIARPLKMTSLQLDFPTQDVPGSAIGYIKKRDSIVRAPEDAAYWKHGAGGFKSNIADFARWAEGLIDGRLVTAKTRRQMWQAQTTKGGEKTTWGLGFTVEDDKGGLKVSHNGSQDEVSTRMVLYPEARHGVVVMSNCRYANPGKFSTAVYSALSGR